MKKFQAVFKNRNVFNWTLDLYCKGRLWVGSTALGDPFSVSGISVSKLNPGEVLLCRHL
jgi:hypothetical protein